MMIYILVFLCVVVTHVVGDVQLHPIKAQDLKSIVDSVKEDVDRHLKSAYAGRNIESLSLPDYSELSSVEDTENREYKNFMKLIQDSMHHHLVKNLGEPSDAENDASTTYLKLTPENKNTFSIESAGTVSNTDKDRSGESISEVRVGSTKGVPGVNFPDYTDIPITSFTCSDKPLLPRFYADLDTGCQVFHMCWPDRRESFLCPMGTTFNQALGVCDYWYNSNCSSSPHYVINSVVTPHLINAESELSSESLHEKINHLETRETDSTTYGKVKSDSVVPFISQFIPVKAKIVVYPQTATQRLKIVTTASIGESKRSGLKKRLHKKNFHAPKHSRVPRSVEYTKSAEDYVENLPEYPLERTLFLFLEALDRAMEDIESNETLERFSGNAKRAVESVKSFINSYVKEPLEQFNPKPGSDMYKMDIKMREIMEHEVWKHIVLMVSIVMDEYREMKENYLQEHEAEPLTNLNPKFIIELPQPTSGLKDSEIPTHVKRVKSSSANLSNLANGDRLNIHPETKKLMLKNYMKLFESKHKHA